MAFQFAIDGLISYSSQRRKFISNNEANPWIKIDFGGVTPTIVQVLVYFTNQAIDVSVMLRDKTTNSGTAFTNFKKRREFNLITSRFGPSHFSFTLI
jgi:hypothetical protein